MKQTTGKRYFPIRLKVAMDFQIVRKEGGNYRLSDSKKTRALPGLHQAQKVTIQSDGREWFIIPIPKSGDFWGVPLSQMFLDLESGEWRVIAQPPPPTVTRGWDEGL